MLGSKFCVSAIVASPGASLSVWKGLNRAYVGLPQIFLSLFLTQSGESFSPVRNTSCIAHTFGLK